MNFGLSSSDRFKVEKIVNSLCKTIQLMGGIQYAASCGSNYFEYNGKKVRISDHASGGFSSLKYNDPDINIVVRPCDNLAYYLKKYFEF